MHKYFKIAYMSRVVNLLFQWNYNNEITIEDRSF